MTVTKEDYSPSIEGSKDLIAVELDPKKWLGFERYVTTLLDNLKNPDSFVKERKSLLKPLGGNSSPNTVLPKTKGELLWNFPYGEITLESLERLADHYKPIVGVDGEIELKYPQESNDQVQFIAPKDIRNSGDSLFLTNSQFFGPEDVKFQTTMLVDTSVSQKPDLETNYQLQLDHYDRALHILDETNLPGGRGCIFGSSGSDSHFQYIASNKKKELRSEKFPDEVILESKQVLELECKATEAGFYYIIVVAKRDNGTSGFVFTMSDLTKMGCDRPILSALDYKNLRLHKKLIFYLCGVTNLVALSLRHVATFL